MPGTWSEATGTWDHPLSEPLSVETEYSGDGNFGLAKTVKFMKALRFRKINFEVEIDTDGRSTTAVKLFSLTVVVLTKQKIVQGIS
jgi:hypothetical protein